MPVVFSRLAFQTAAEAAILARRRGERLQ